MFSNAWVRLLCITVLLAACCARVQAAEPGKIYVMTDLEGISGVYNFSQTRETTGTLAREAREDFMGDLAAVIRGLRAGGATEIVVMDGHGNGALIPHLMEPGAKYMTGRPRPHGLYGLDESFAGFVIVGQHAMKGTEDGVLHHTQSSRTENQYWYNGVETGELGQCAAVAGHYGVPTILITGDVAACREAKQFLGPECVTVPVKKGISREAAELWPFEQTRKALFEGAKNAMAAIPRCKPYTMKEPIKVKKQSIKLYPEGPKLITKEGTIESVVKIFSF